MFPDSKIAAQFSAQRSKLSYLLNFGLAPHLLGALKQRLKDSDFFVLLFDETLNKEMGKKQLDMHVRFWDGNQVKTRYYATCMMGHARAEDLLQEILQIDVDLSKVLQISMDGPSVNWKVHRLLTDHIEDVNSKRLLPVGSCGLHTVHNAFKDGHVASGWDLGHWFASLTWLLKDTPARREDFTAATGCTQFPLNFCQHRWLENVPVAERALKIWPSVKKFLAEMKPLTTKSFLSLTDLAMDPLLEVKAHCFISLAKDVEPFLRQFQSNKPLMPYLAAGLERCLKALMERYKMHLEAKKYEEDDLTKKRKRDECSAELEELKKSKKRLLDVIVGLEKAADRDAEIAVTSKNPRILIVQPIATRKEAKERRAELERLETSMAGKAKEVASV